MAETAADALALALDALSLELSAEVVSRLLAYIDLLARHGATHNLVGTLEPTRIAYEIVADSLLAVPVLRGVRTAIDVGSGAGVPGVPLAIALPDVQFTLLEPRRKRIDFLTTARRSLGLTNVTPVEGRSEGIAAAIASGRHEPFGAAVSRAVFAPPEWVAVGRQLVAPGAPIGVWLTEANAGAFLAEHGGAEVRAYELPGVEARRFAVVAA